jgi:transcriptional regulator with XRE-family HTH domain
MHGMTDVGAELARARESLGLSRDDLARRTKISAAHLQALEHNHAHQLPPLVYVQGFVRTCARELGLDPDETVKRYLAQFTSDAGDVWVTNTPDNPSELFGSEEAEPHRAGIASTVPVVEPQRPVAVRRPWPAVTPVAAAATDRPRETRHDAARVEPTGQPDARPAAPHPPQVVTHHPSASMSSTIRPLRLLAAGLVAAAASFLVVTLLFSRGGPQAQWPRGDPAVVGQQADSQIEEAPASAAARMWEGAPPASTEEPARADQRAPWAGPPVPPAPDADAPPQEAALAAGDLTGWWQLTNRVDAATVPSYTGMELGFRLQLEQDGTRVTGHGQKWSENGRSVPPAARTPITVDGTVVGGRLELVFTEQGAHRTSSGRIVLQQSGDGLLQGTFASGAARARGTSYARRMP